MNPTVTPAQATRIIDRLIKQLEENSSYIWLTDYNYKAHLTALKNAIIQKGDNVEKALLANKMERILAKIGDRHSFVTYTKINQIQHSLIRKRFPFYACMQGGKMLALDVVPHPTANRFSLKFPATPFVKTINGQTVREFFNTYGYLHKKAPTTSFFQKSIFVTRRIGRSLYSNDEKNIDRLSIKLTNTTGTAELNREFILNNSVRTYYSDVENIAINLKKQVVANPPNFNGLSRVLPNNIGYLLIPSMFNYGAVLGLEAHLKAQMNGPLFATRALIIDLRYNTGGRRDIIHTIAPYFVMGDVVVVNKAYLRKGRSSNGLHKKGLYQRNHANFNANDRLAIDNFDAGFAAVRPVKDFTKFKDPFYMLLKSGPKTYPNHVYILINEATFSAASVFASVLKGFRNVTIVGVTSDGSSGNSQSKNLENSNIVAKVSTMVSYQKNGKTLDGNGTLPDVVKKANRIQILGISDTQLKHVTDDLIGPP